TPRARRAAGRGPVPPALVRPFRGGERCSSAGRLRGLRGRARGGRGSAEGKPRQSRNTVNSNVFAVGSWLLPFVATVQLPGIPISPVPEEDGEPRLIVCRGRGIVRKGMAGAAARPEPLASGLPRVRRQPAR